jgi:hypothetical protein
MSGTIPHIPIPGAHPKFFLGAGEGVAEFEAVNNLCLILKIML